jgi:hypothetical protein
MMAVAGLVQDAAQPAGQALVQAPAEDLRDVVGAQPQQTQIAGTLEELVDGKVAPKDQVAAILHLLQRVVAAEVDGVAVFFGELGAHYQGPILQAGANDAGTERIGGGLQRFRVSHPQKRIVVFAKLHSGAAQLLFDEVVPVEVISDGKGQERTYA